MSKSKHTPGPWSVGKNRVATHSQFSIRAGNGKQIGTMEDHYWSREHNDVPMEQEANATLISAAPEMLEMLKRVVTSANGHGDSVPVAELYALINKAQGGAE